MANTSFDLTRAGVFFQNAAISIHQRVQQDLQTLDFPHIQELLNKEQELAIKSKTLFVMAVVKIGEEAKNSFESLEDASQQIDEVIRKVEKIQNVIDFATTLVSTASAIISGDVGKIVSNARNLLDDIVSFLPAKNDNA